VEEKAGNTTKSLAALSRAVTAAPNDARAWRLLAAARVRSARTPEEFARAEEALARAERLTPALPMIPYQRGLLRAREGRHSEAIGEFQRALERNPNFTDALYNLSLSLAFAGRAEESAQARKRFERASDYQRDRTALQLRLSADPENLALWRRLAQRAEAQQDIATADLARRHILALESARQRAAP
jgi:tetratricopeptide (TPR) repeat protein